MKEEPQPSGLGYVQVVYWLDETGKDRYHEMVTRHHLAMESRLALRVPCIGERVTFTYGDGEGEEPTYKPDEWVVTDIETHNSCVKGHQDIVSQQVNIWIKKVG